MTDLIKANPMFDPDNLQEVIDDIRRVNDLRYDAKCNLSVMFGDEDTAELPPDVQEAIDLMSEMNPAFERVIEILEQRFAPESRSLFPPKMQSKILSDAHALSSAMLRSITPDDLVAHLPGAWALEISHRHDLDPEIPVIRFLNLETDHAAPETLVLLLDPSGGEQLISGPVLAGSISPLYTPAFEEMVRYGFRDRHVLRWRDDLGRTFTKLWLETLFRRGGESKAQAFATGVTYAIAISRSENENPGPVI